MIVMAAKDEVGRRGEQLAAQFLEKNGYRILDRNWRGVGGELDAVALDGRVLAAVEVKTRSSARFGHPFEAVTPAKLARIGRLLGQWLASNSPNTRPRYVELRIDVVSVLLPPDGIPTIELIKGVSL
ncbi:MAG: YraN family protein [Promicromonosporaceae bacterium]|nr:YraN family protein [Promicromonosporaceae bacterium]